MMLFRTQCEVEGCSHQVDFAIINHRLSTLRLVCTDHEAVKTADELSTPFPYPAPPEP